MRGIPGNVDVLVFHPYVYGVLDDLSTTYGLRGDPRTSTKPAPSGTSCARRTALADWAPDGARGGCRHDRRQPEIYVHDWCDAEAFDRWLYGHYPVSDRR